MSVQRCHYSNTSMGGGWMASWGWASAASALASPRLPRTRNAPAYCSGVQNGISVGARGAGRVGGNGCRGWTVIWAHPSGLPILTFSTRPSLPLLQHLQQPVLVKICVAAAWPGPWPTGGWAPLVTTLPHTCTHGSGYAEVLGATFLFVFMPFLSVMRGSADHC